MQSLASDLELLRRLSADSSAAMRSLYDRHAPAVFRLVASRATDAASVDDIVQETFMVLWRKRASLQIAGESVLPWLLVTARNMTMNENRAGSRRPLASELETLVSESFDGPERAAEVAALLRSVADIVATLPPLDQRLYAVCIEQELSYEKAAAVLGITPAAVRNRLSRLRSRIRNDDYVRGAL
ncbi:sigma-70 family RNA polymerase sigma factor [Microbacteriaceae bacterium VKM Ac-2855]|nr:sigma-70 family RNA polymerase sigma factor [Microbacteriaceae bacterium VKM Ac-2855]